MDLMKKIAGVSTPQAPKFRPLSLPGDPVPYLGSSSSEGSSSPCPSTPSLSSPPYPARALSRSSASSGYASRPNTPVHPAGAPRALSPDPMPYIIHKPRGATAKPAAEVHTPIPHRAWAPVPLETPRPRSAAEVPAGDKPLKGILKRRPEPDTSRYVPIPPMSPASSSSSLSPPPIGPSPYPTSYHIFLSETRSASRSAHSASPQPASRGSTPAPLALHWQLLPHSLGVVRKQVVYDFRKDFTFERRSLQIVDFSRGARQRLSDAEVNQYLDRPACDRHQLTEMHVRAERFTDVTITVKASNGVNVRVRDVFEQLYQWLDQPSPFCERDEWVTSPADAKECTAAFNARCKESVRKVDRAEWKEGIRRVDLLKGKAWFRGLTRGVPSSPEDPPLFWVVEFGDQPNV